MYGDAKTNRKPGGHILVDGQEVAQTLQCCHCNTHFVSIRGSGKTRGYCFRCMAVTCGKHECDACVPFEKKLDDYEKGKILTL